MLGLRVQHPQLLTLPTDYGRVTQAQQAHRCARAARITVFLHVAGEQGVFAVRRHLATVHVAAVFAVNELWRLALGIGAPQLRPSVAGIGFLARRTPGEDYLLRIGEPIWRAAVDLVESGGFAGGRVHPCDAPAGAKRVRDATEPLPIRRPGQLLEKTFARETPEFLASRHVHEENASNRQAHDLSAVGAPTGPRVRLCRAEGLRMRTITLCNHQLALLAVPIVVDHRAVAAAAGKGVCFRRARPAARTRGTVVYGSSCEHPSRSADSSRYPSLLARRGHCKGPNRGWRLRRPELARHRRYPTIPPAPGSLPMAFRGRLKTKLLESTWRPSGSW